MDLWKWVLIILAVLILFFFLFPSLFNKTIIVIKKISNTINNIIQSINVKANESTQTNISTLEIKLQRSGT